MQKHNSNCINHVVRAKRPKPRQDRKQIEAMQKRIKDRHNRDTIFTRIRPASRLQHLHMCVYMCVYYESQCMDICLQWSWVICLHYTTTAQPPRAIIYSDLPKHTHSETGSPTCWRQDPLHKAMVWAHNGPFWGLEALDAIQHPNRADLEKAPFLFHPLLFFDLR